MQTSAKRLEVIVKLAEVCNISCTYCYYFESEDKRHYNRPVYIKRTTIMALVQRLEEAYREQLFSEVQFDFHGGEPLMIGARSFARICDELLRVTFPIRFCVTTNAMLIDDEWISLFRMYNVGVCVSIDGPQHVHDSRRTDKRGAGTYDRVIEGVLKLQAAVRGSVIQPISALCVVDPGASGAQVYNHIAHDLKIQAFDFLMPDSTHDSRTDDTEGVRSFMRAAFAAWLEDDDPRIFVRVFSSVMSVLAGGSTHLAGFSGNLPYAITVGSDGTIDGDDFLGFVDKG